MAKLTRREWLKLHEGHEVKMQEGISNLDWAEWLELHCYTRGCFRQNNFILKIRSFPRSNVP